jgi:hypothetical protein
MKLKKLLSLRETANTAKQVSGPPARSVPRRRIVGVSWNVHGTVICFLVVLAAPTLAAQSGRARAQREQTSFFEERPFEHPVPLSHRLLKLLLATKEAQEGLEFATARGERDDPAQLFRAAEVHLHRSGQVDLVVIGICPMRGADNGWFWVIGSAEQSPRVVLFANGNSIEVMSSRTNGYHDIRSLFSTPSETRICVYRFDGRLYKLWKKQWTKNPD